jgi:hypothetical protein
MAQSRKEDKKKQQTIINFDLGEAVPVSKIDLTFAKEVDFYRTYKLQYLADSFKVDKDWRYTYNTLTSGTLSSIEDNKFHFSPTVLQKLKLTINNRDNAPLKLEKTTVSGPVYQIISRFDRPANYDLYYGNEKARKPNYDIQQFLNKIPEELKILKLGEEFIWIQFEEEEDKPLFQSKCW